MADDVEMTPVEMTPVEMTPVDAAEPPKADPLAKPAEPKPATLKLNPVPRKPVGGTATVSALRPGLKLPPKPGVGSAALKPGLKLPTQNALKPGLKLPPKPGATVSALRPGLNLPPKPGSTVSTLRPGVKLPQKPVIRKPGSTVATMPLPRPVIPKPVAPAAAADTAVTLPAPAQAAPADAAKPAQAPVPAPVAVDAQGVGKLPTVEAKAIERGSVTPVAMPSQDPVKQLKSVTQKLKGITQEIPQQAILRKTGIIAEDAMSEAQKAAAKHKTARISLSDAMGVAPVKNENAPLKTIRIKRPVDLPNPTAQLKSPAVPAEGSGDAAAGAAAPAAPAEKAGEAKTTATQRKTLKIARPGGVVRPAGKFGLKRPSTSAATAPKPQPAAAGGDASSADDAPTVATIVPDIADIPNIPSMPPQPAKAAATDGPSWVWTLSAIVQFAACVAIGALAWLLYQNSQTQYF